LGPPCGRRSAKLRPRNDSPTFNYRRAPSSHRQNLSWTTVSQAEYINELNERAAQKEQVRRFLTCIACGKLHDRDSDRDSDEASNCACRECQRKYPPSLFWAAIQVVHAAPRLRTGEVIHFSQAHIQGDFITLRYIRVQNDPHVDMPHDLDVRRDDI